MKKKGYVDVINITRPIMKNSKNQQTQIEETQVADEHKSI